MKRILIGALVISCAMVMAAGPAAGTGSSWERPPR